MTTQNVGVAPYVAIQLIALIILAAFPELANLLPRLVYGSTYI